MMFTSIFWLLPATGFITQVVAQNQASYVCPQNRNHEYTTNGKKYTLRCDISFRGKYLEASPCASVTECADRCAKNPDCVHSSMDKNNRCLLKPAGEKFDISGMSTWEFTELVDNGGSQGGSNPQVPPGGDSAQAPITGDQNTGNGASPYDGPLTGEENDNLAKYSCPGHKKQRYSTHGVIYELHCDTGHSGGHMRSETAASQKECADLCAQETECFSCDFDESASRCSLKKAPAELIPYTGIHSWWPTQCPKERVKQAKKDPEITTEQDLACPRNDGKIFEGSDGTWFYLQCCTDTDAAVILDYKTVSSAKECSEECVKDKKCKGFMYAHALPPAAEPQASCRLYENGNFSTTKAEGMHYAFVTDPPTKEPVISDAKLCSTTCPEADGQLFVTPTGQNYLMSCNKRHGTTYLKIDRRGSFEACMTACATMPACHSAEFEPRTKKCYFSNNHNAPNISAQAFASAHSLGCSGACSSCKKGCDRLDADSLPADMASCNTDHGKVMVAGGEDFRLQCTHCFYSDGRWRLSGPKTMAECAKACADDPQCHGANWIVDENSCTAHGPDRNGGKKPSFGQSEQCHAMVPLDRSCANTDSLEKQ